MTSLRQEGAPARGSSGRPERKLATRYTRYVGPVALVLAIFGVGSVALVEAIGWLDQPFVGFFAYSSGLVSPMQRSEWSGRRAGMLPGDQVLRIDGIAFADKGALLAHLRTLKPGQKVRVDAVRKGRPQIFELTVTDFTREDVLVTLATPFSIGIFYLLVGTVIFLLKPMSRAARLLLVLLSLISLFYLTTFDANTNWTLERLWICYPLFGAVSVHLFTIFPERWKFAERHRWILAFPYGIALILILLRQGFINAAEGTTALAYASTAFVSLVTIANFFVLVLIWKQTDSQITIRKAKVIIVGILATSTLGVVWSYAARVDPEAITWDLAMLLSAPFPILMTYAVLKHNIFDVDGVLRKTAIYALSTGLVVALYFGLVAFFTLITQQYLPFYETTLTAVLATLAVALLFNPLRVAVQRFLNRFFFREKYDLHKAHAELTQELSRVTALDLLARVLSSRLKRLFRVDSVALLVREQGSSQLVPVAPGHPHTPWAGDLRFAADGPLGDLLLTRNRPTRASDVIENQKIPSDDRENLAAQRARLLLPLSTRDALNGMLIIGGETFDKVFTHQDLRLLEMIQAPLSIAVQNAILYNERAEKERLAALGQVASLIIHEIKNPLGIIKVSIGTIKRKLEDDASQELAEFIGDEVDRMNRTIAKILTFARPQDIHREPCDVNELVRRTLAFVHPDLEGAGVQLESDLDPSVPPIQADGEQLTQVLLNLILNAKGAVGSDGWVRVATRAVGGRDLGGGLDLELSVSDNGAGVDEETMRQMFTPFFTTRRGGTGLGLAIVQQVVQGHGGEIRVESQPGRGSTFIVRIPAVQATAIASATG